MQTKLDKVFKIIVDISNRKVTIPQAISWYVTDENIAHLNCQVIDEVEDSIIDIQSYKLSMRVLTPSRILKEVNYTLSDVTNNIFTLTLPDELITEKGRHQCELSIEYLGDKLTSEPFNYNIIQSIANQLDDTISKDSHYPLVLELEDKLKEWNNILDEQVSKVIILDNDVRNAEKTRQANEAQRIEAENERQEGYIEFKNEVNEQLVSKINNELFYDIKTEKFRHNNGTDYYITEIPFSIKPKIGIAKGGVGNVQSTLEFAREQRASLCINAGIFNMETNVPQGSLMINGEIFTDRVYTNTTSAEILAIDDNGMLASFDSNNHTATSLMNKGYNNCVQGWYPFIRGGEYLGNRSSTDYQPLQAIGQKTNGDYVIFSCDGRTHYDKGMSIPEAAEVLLSYDVVYAYNLDGGGSVSTVNKLIKQNKNIDNMIDDRLVSTFIYFEKETVDNDVFDAFEEIARLKQEINEKLVELRQIESGYISLKAKSGHHYPGVEFYKNNENTRLGKVEMSSYNNFKVAYNDGEGEKEILKAKLDGLYDVNGKLADFHRMPTLIADCNAVRGSGIFRTSSSTLNTPVVEAQGFIINLDYDNETNANIVQIYMGKDSYFLGYRVIFADGSTSNWMNYSNMYSSTRPTNDRILKGFTMFDSKINKLIIYKGDGVWVDCNGTMV